MKGNMLARWRLLVAASVVAAGLATFVLTAMHQHREATRRLDAANAALGQRHWRDAIDNAHAAALRAWPRSAIQREAFALLGRTARSAATAGDPSAALFAWTDMRQAAIATRSVLCDTTAWESEADDGVRTASGSNLQSAPLAVVAGDGGGLRLATAGAVLALAAAIVLLTRGRGGVP